MSNALGQRATHRSLARWQRIAATAAALLIGCGGAATPPSGVPPEANLELETIAGLRIAALPRSTPGLVHLALYLDAGSRDASPPQLATVSAWTAADAAAAPPDAPPDAEQVDVSATVLPDGTAFEAACESSAVARCVEALARALAHRVSDESTLSALRTRLTGVRRGADAEVGRIADRLAIEALLGPDSARGFSPLGRAEDDAALTPAALEAFLADHYGRERALLVAAGDVSVDVLRDAVASAFGRAPDALQERSEREVRCDDGARSSLVVGPSNAVSAAAWVADGPTAIAVARDAAHSPLLADDGARGRLSVRGFGVRGGGLVLVRVVGAPRAPATGRRLATALGRAALEAPGPRAVALPADPRQATQVLGHRWLAVGAADDDAPELAIGVGASVAGGRADHLRAEDPDERRRERVAAALSEAVARAATRLFPAIDGESDDYAASIALADNGARIDIRRRPADSDVAIAIRFLGGGTLDPPTLHGRAAVLARLSALACAERGSASGAASTVAPIVTASTHGLIVYGPKAHARALITRALDCALSPPLDEAVITQARLSAIDAIDPIANAAAAALSPGSPGAVAPGGSLGTLSNVGVGALRRELLASRVGARVSVAIVGDVEVRQTLLWTARRLSHLAGGRLPATAPLALRGDDAPTTFDHRGPTPRAVIAFEARGADRPDALSARAFASALGEALGRHPGIRAVGVRGGETPVATWAAVAVDVTEEALGELPGRVAVTVPTALTATAAVRASFEQEARWTAARPEVAAATLSEERLLGAAPDGEVRSLAQSPPAFSIGRPD